MAQILSEVRFGWKRLEQTFQAFKYVINHNCPLEGEGIRIVDTEQGKQISIAQDAKGKAPAGSAQQGGTGGSGGPGVPVTIQAFDTNNKPVTITVFTDGNGFSNSTLAWQPVAVVDPASCAQSTITVLEKPSS